ncbi:Fur family transcriptional regulator [Aliarcobacter cibarius]|jgi:Fur family transcriptional regulator, peroxide stress response regulator|uniref:Peroxide stress transcriptional regulator PerR n=1 Tax=Aliarcobacter cibarius TaxID=255507 RepID=A0A5J6RGN9_9BACT|nr:Fur family transcriptional regulator [Aliarcobacter cibarius]QEZ89459.1 peroxide stress transcriptional regulator PerR [Aliarcobacter cibarius]QKJ27458.1 peroxide stress transcriptional regulator PerR [Aliarcobacter cibarius]TLS99295.1 transcriptional repressor [Aliarcobacter cibarius]TLT00438.1 transcriptional repressor [Aliarcobacter cibarius]TLT04348.1 transcriptional repressor [Aliarcobacter cibarius]
MTNYANLLKEYDLKVTPQRVAIVDELYMNGHMNIDELYKKLLDRFPSVSLATIYKNVNSMLEKTFLSEVKIPNSKSVYELVKTEHAHLVCKECGFIEDVILDSTDILEQVSKISQFKVDNTDIVLSGTCKKCCK